MIDPAAFTRLCKPTYIIIGPGYGYPGMGRTLYGLYDGQKSIPRNEEGAPIEHCYNGSADIKNEQHNNELFKPHTIFDNLKQVKEVHPVIGHVQREIMYNNVGVKIIDKVTDTHQMLCLANALWVLFLLCLTYRTYGCLLMPVTVTIVADLYWWYNTGRSAGCAYYVLSRGCFFAFI